MNEQRRRQRRRLTDNFTVFNVSIHLKLNNEINKLRFLKCLNFYHNPFFVRLDSNSIDSVLFGLRARRQLRKNISFRMSKIFFFLNEAIESKYNAMPLLTANGVCVGIESNE